MPTIDEDGGARKENFRGAPKGRGQAAKEENTEFCLWRHPNFALPIDAALRPESQSSSSALSHAQHLNQWMMGFGKVRALRDEEGRVQRLQVDIEALAGAPALRAEIHEQSGKVYARLHEGGADEEAMEALVARFRRELQRRGLKPEEVEIERV